MPETAARHAHLITGGFPPGSYAGHDHDYARLRLLELLAEQDVAASVANDFADVARWLPLSRLMITYVAGPYPDAAQPARSANGPRRAAIGSRSMAQAAAAPSASKALARAVPSKPSITRSSAEFF